jgi:hypothetical protein
MRRLAGLALLLLVLGCAPPRASGGLWALDEAHLEEETVYRTPDVQRRAQARDVELGVADDLLAADESRLSALVAGCPGAPVALSAASAGDGPRDAARARDDAQRRSRAARLAVADWAVRRGATTGQASFCQQARQALAGSLVESTVPELALIQALPPGEVSVGGSSSPGQPLDAAADPAMAMLSFRLGLVDGVRGPALLVAELAAVYGGALSLPVAPPRTDLAPEDIVDRVAPALAIDWEPDGVYAALRAVTR